MTPLEIPTRIYPLPFNLSPKEMLPLLGISSNEEDPFWGIEYHFYDFTIHYLHREEPYLYPETLPVEILWYLRGFGDRYLSIVDGINRGEVTLESFEVTPLGKPLSKYYAAIRKGPI